MTSRALALSALLLVVALAIDPPAGASPDDVGRYAAPEGAPYTTEEVRIEAFGGHVLAGTLAMPRGASAARRRGSVPVVVLISGVGAEDRDLSNGDFRPFRQIADTLARRGVGVLRLDDPGVGASMGSLESTDTNDRASDTWTAIEFLRRRPQVAKERIGLVGWDEGALIAPILASTDPGIRAIVLMGSPGRVGRDLLAWQVRDSSHPGPVAIPPAPATRAWQRQAEDERWARFFADFDPLARARPVRAPVLILQGAADEVVPPEDSARLAEAFRAGGNRDVTRIEWPGANHAFLPDSAAAGEGFDSRKAALPPKLLGTIADWIVTRLRPVP